MYVFTNPPHRKDMTQAQFLSLTGLRSEFKIEPNLRNLFDVKKNNDKYY